MIVLDASVLIAHLNRTDPHHARAHQLLTDAAGDQLAASSITLAEVLVAPARTGQLALARATVVELGIHELALGVGGAERLAELRARTRLRLPDCCVLLAAEQTGGATIATFDDRLASHARDLRLTVRMTP